MPGKTMIHTCLLLCLLLLQPNPSTALSVEPTLLQPAKAQATNGEGSLKAVDALRDQADGLEAAGNYAEALPLREKALAAYSRQLGPKHPATLHCLNELSLNFLEQGRISDALQTQEKVLQLRTQALGENHPDTLASLQNLGNIYGQLGRYADAVSLYEQALKQLTPQLGKQHPDTLACMNNLSILYGLLGKLDAGRELSESVVQTLLTTAGEQDQNTLGSMSNLASIYRDLGRSDDALALYTKVLELSIRALGENHPDTLSSRVNLANAYQDSGRLQEALALNEQVMLSSSDVWGPDHPLTIDNLIKTANLCQQLGRYDEALILEEKAVAGIERMRRQGALSNENRQALFAKFSEIYQDLARLYLLQQKTDKAFHASELAKARTLLEASAARFADQSGILAPEESARLKDYDRRLSRIDADLAKTPPQTESKVLLEAQKNELIQAITSFRQTLTVKYPKYAQLLDVQLIDADAGKTLIPDDAVFISFLVGKGSAEHDRSVALFTLTRDGGLQAVSLNAIPHLEETLIAYNHALQGIQVWRMQDGSYFSSRSALRPDGALATAGPKEIGEYLGEKLLKPIQTQLARRHWILSPDGPLALVPFEPMSIDGQRAIDTHDISYIQSLSMLNLLMERKRAYQSLEGRTDLFAMGGAEYPGGNTNFTTRGTAEAASGITPDIDPSALRGGFTKQAVESIYQQLLRFPWQSLPTSEHELDNLSALFGKQADIFRKQDASEAKLLELNRRNALEKYRYLVFSTHGYFCPEEPGLSSVVLNQVHKTPDTDGYITAVKWPAYNLKSDLMFFSACETGIGRIIHGEGVTGLPFALYVAGNTNTVFTLWKVVDESSTLFSDSFFKKIRLGKDHVEALSETKREMLANPRYSHPLFWAPYVLYGQ